MKKQLSVIGIVTLLICIGFSGCTDTKKEELKPANVILKNVTYSPKKPVENKTIIFTVALENTGDENDTSIIQLKGTSRDAGSFTTSSNSFTINGHSQKNVTVSTAKNIINEGAQSFEIGIVGPQTNYVFKSLQTLDIDIEPGAPEIYFITTASNVITFGNYTEDKTFESGDLVYVYYEYKNINHDNVVELYRTISVTHKTSWVGYYNDNKYGERSLSESDDWAAWWPFTTYTYPNNWPTGEYQVDIGIQDKISGKTTTSTVYFTLN
jgi:hypothetical protein